MKYSVLVYYDLMLYVLALSLFIPLWCVMVLCYQVFESLMVSMVLPKEASILEFVWTLVPTFLVLMLCFFKLKYLTYYGAFKVTVPVKIIGHQWYWTYELSESMKYDSFMTDLVSGVNKPLRMYLKVPYSLLLTSADVIHSFSIPDLSLKVDAMPGRMKCLKVIFDRLGVFSGYCSELCGVGHSYMPMVMEVIMSSSVKGA